MDASISVTSKNKKIFLYQVAFVAALGGFLFGYDTGIISGAILFIRQDYLLSTFIQEVIISSVVLGALMGALFSGRLTHALGSRRMLMYMSITFIFGTLLSTLATSISILILGRFIVGIAIGITSYASPLLISEMAPAINRGGLVLLNGIMITSGETVAFLVNYVLVPTESWRLMFVTGILPAMLLFIGMLLLPPSPRWMVLKGRIDQARSILNTIRDPLKVEAELNEIIQHCQTQSVSWKALFSPWVRPVLIIGMGLGVFQQFVGINTVMYYGPTIFKVAGFHTDSTQILATFGLGLMNTIMTIVTVLIVDKVGRRRLLMGGIFVASISLSLVGLIFHFNITEAWAVWAAFGLLMMYVAGYCLSLGSLFWLIIAEIYPLALRSMAMSFVTATQWAASFLVAISFLSIVHVIGMAFTFWMYAFMCLVTFLFCHYLVPETTGVSLEHIEKNLREGKPSRELGHVSIC